MLPITGSAEVCVVSGVNLLGNGIAISSDETFI